MPDESRVALFEEHRNLLTGVAYRILGSVSDAQDMVQEAWLRWAEADNAEIRSPRGWLIAVVSRLSLDRLKSAQVQREHYYGTWLPEPFLERDSDTSNDQLDESVSVALLVVLEKLSPPERVGFLLHDVFGYSFEEIAQVLDRSAVNCRKLVSRARSRVRTEKPRFTTTGRQHEEFLNRFIRAARAGEIESLMELLDESATLYTDGGGKVSALPVVLVGGEDVARFFLSIARNPEAGLEENGTRFVLFNGTPGLLLYFRSQPVTALSLEIRNNKIVSIFAQRNPDKLEIFSETTAY